MEVATPVHNMERPLEDPYPADSSMLEDAAPATNQAPPSASLVTDTLLPKAEEPLAPESTPVNGLLPVSQDVPAATDTNMADGDLPSAAQETPQETSQIPPEQTPMVLDTLPPPPSEPVLESPPEPAVAPVDKIEEESVEATVLPSIPAEIDSRTPEPALPEPALPAPDATQPESDPAIDTTTMSIDNTAQETSQSSQGPEPVPASLAMAVDEESKSPAPIPETNGLVRPREDDDAEPPAKRAKVETDEVVDTQSPADAVSVEPAAPAADPAPAEDTAAPANDAPTTDDGPGFESVDSGPMTPEQKKYLLEQVRKSKKVKTAGAFLHPVDVVALNIPTYNEIIKKPMDLSTIEKQLKEPDHYHSVDDVIRDVHLMVNNAKRFNGVQHPVYLAGENLRTYFMKTLAHLPAKGAEPVADASKKAKKPTPEKRTSLPRRESRMAPPPATNNAGSPSTTFAVGPDGMPLIRRDSAANDRPKREIHRPAPKDLPYSNPRPRKKKNQLEMKFAEYMLKTLYDKSNYNIVYPFYKPVDPVALNIPNYHNVVKKPMDLETVEKNLKNGHYTTLKEFKVDIELMLKNCFKFNPETDFVHQLGKQTEALFKQLWDEKDDWIRDNAPPSEPRSEEEDEEDDEEEEEEEPENDQAHRLELLQKQMAALHAEMTSLVSAANTGNKRASPTAKGSKKAAKPSKSSGTKKVKRSESNVGATAPAPKPTKVKKEKKTPKLTQEQKREVSDGIQNLDDVGMGRAVQIIRNGVPSLRHVNDDELELDIDEIPEHVVYELYKFVRNINKSSKTSAAAANVPDAGAFDEPEDDDYAPPARARGGQAGPGRKKNKPMTATEQERKIAEIKAQLENYGQGASAENGTGSSARDSDDDDESESEEE